MSLLKALGPKKPLRDYMAQYRDEHQHPGTKATHMIGIPMILASLPLAPVAPPVAGALFVGGWALQFAGHALFEKQKPSFFSDPFYLLVGAVWVGVEYAELLHLPIPEALRPSEAPAAEPTATNGASHEAHATA